MLMQNGTCLVARGNNGFVWVSCLLYTSSTGKYQCILVNPKQHRILDIFQDRPQSHLADYWRSIPRKERLNVKFFVCDMWRPCTELTQTFFPNAKIIINIILSASLHGSLKIYASEFSAPCQLLCVSILNAAGSSFSPAIKSRKMRTNRPVT